MLVSLLALTALVAVLGHARPYQRLRRRASTRAGEESRAAPSGFVERRGRRLMVCIAAGAVLGWAAVGTGGLPFGAAAGALASWWAGRLEAPSQTRRREAMQRDLPLAVDLLAACATVGLPPDRALVVVSASLPGPVGEELSGVASRLVLGVDPVAEWRRLGREGPIAPLARTMLRSLESGAPLAAGLSRLASDRRRELRSLSQVRARRVGVQAAGPLGLCFLPAFMLIGVVPTVVGTFTALILR